MECQEVLNQVYEELQSTRLKCSVMLKEMYDNDTIHMEENENIIDGLIGIEDGIEELIHRY